MLVQGTKERNNIIMPYLGVKLTPSEGCSNEEIAQRCEHKAKTVRAMYNRLMHMFLPDHVYSWTREEFVRHLKIYVLPQYERR